MKQLLMLVAIGLLAASASAQTAHGVGLSWSNAGAANSGNCIYSSLVSGGPYTKITCTASPATSYLVPLTNTNSGIKTYFVVDSVFPVTGESAFSNEVSATFPVFPTPPTGLSAANQ